ncbi:MAG: hypothetical protein IPN01_34115 [Deltaproteobacteria bacterium]|nr:hypothetical protein [Deltaproteobacteria bacterium]
MGAHGVGVGGLERDERAAQLERGELVARGGLGGGEELVGLGPIARA